MEIDRVLRPGGYWIFSGPPIGWKISYKAWERRMKDLEEEQTSLEDLAKRLCWKKVSERGAIVIWRKPINHYQCMQNIRALKSPRFCDANDPDAGWYVFLTMLCIFQLYLFFITSISIIYKILFVS